MKKHILTFAFLCLVAVASLNASGFYEIAAVTKVGSIETGFGQGSAKTAAYSKNHMSLCIANPTQKSVDIVSVSVPSRPNITQRRRIDISDYGKSANSVAVRGETIAVAVENEDKAARGQVLFYDFKGRILNSVDVGFVPDMLCFTPDGAKVLVANEGTPSTDYKTDPEGSISIIDIAEGIQAAKVYEAGFSGFNRKKFELIERGVRIYGPNATVAQDLEPESITVSKDSKRAWVTLQENNAIAELDIDKRRITKIYPLGYKDHSKEGNGFDASDQDGKINIQSHSIWGLYQPAAISSFVDRGRIYLVTANGGKARNYEGFNEETRVGELKLDATAFPDAESIQKPTNLGRLKTTTAMGDFDLDGDHEVIFSFGGRSFSIWRVERNSLTLVYDSGSDFERITAELYPAAFNCNSGITKKFDDRSDDRGVEPESIAVGYWLGQRYAFVGLAQGLGGIMIYNITDPEIPTFVTYVISNDGSGKKGNDVSPAGITFIHTLDTPTTFPMLAVSYQHSGTVALYYLKVQKNEENTKKSP